MITFKVEGSFRQMGYNFLDAGTYFVVVDLKLAQDI